MRYIGTSEPDASDKVFAVSRRRNINKLNLILRMNLEDAPRFARLIQTLQTLWKPRMRIKDLISVLEKYAPELDIRVRQD